MRRVLLPMVVVLSLVSAIRAQDDLAGKISCHRNGSEDPQNRPYTKKLLDGYEISLGPARNGTVDGNGCTAAIYDGGGRVVFRTTGFSVIFDENHTGLDVDGDGKADVVFITDTGGGNHCCWAYNVVSLFPKPHRLFDLPYPVRFAKDMAGKILIWENFPGPYSLTTSAKVPVAERVFRVSQGTLVDNTPEFCPQILAQRRVNYDQEPISEKTGKLPSGSEPGDDATSALLSVALQHAVCRQFDKALHYLNLWPEETGNPVTSQKKVMAAFAESIKQDYPDFAARLMSLSGEATASRPARRIEWLKDLSVRDTLLAAKLTPAEEKQILDQVESTSFDAPDSWDKELRVRRVSLGDSDGLLVRGTQLLCGGTGNCETWVFRRSQGKWLNMFVQEAPIVSGFAFEEDPSQGVKDFLVSASSSAAKESRTLFKFDGEVYRQSKCYEVSIDHAGAEKIEKVPCK